MGPLTSRESSCDSSQGESHRSLSQVCFGGTWPKRDIGRNTRAGAPRFFKRPEGPATGSGWRWLTHPLAHHSAEQVLLLTSGLWGLGHRPVLQAPRAAAVGPGRLPRSEHVTSWNVLAELRTAFTKHCAAARRTSEVPEPRRGAPQQSPSLYRPPRAWETPGPPQQGVREDTGPWGGSRGRR